MFYDKRMTQLNNIPKPSNLNHSSQNKSVLEQKEIHNIDRYTFKVIKEDTVTPMDPLGRGHSFS